MAATLQQVYDITQNATFQHRVMASSYYVARQILATPAVNPAGASAWGLAQSVLSNPSATGLRFVNALATDPVISAAEAATPDSSTDAQLVSATQSVWNYLAGALVI